MKKILSIFLVLALAFSVIACTKNGDGEGGAAKSDDVFKVGVIYIGSINDGGFTQTQHEGVKAMEKYFKGKVKAIYMENVKDEDKSAAINAATNLIDQGCKVIMGGSFGFGDALDELANSGDYDDIKFIHFSGNKMNDKNFGNFFGATEEPRYLTGMVAGMMTKSNKLGYVGAFPYTEVQIGINAFTLGAQSVNPNAIVKVAYVNSWYDPEKERSAADELLNQGCDVIAQHCDTTGPQVAAAEKGAYSIGYNLDTSKIEAVKGGYLTAPIWHHEKYLIPAIEAIMDGTWKPESYYGNMKDGYMGIAKMTDLVPADVQAKVKEAEDKIIAGEFAPFSGKIEYNDGRVLCKEGQTLTREEIWKIDGLVKGAVGE